MINDVFVLMNSMMSFCFGAVSQPCLFCITAGLLSIVHPSIELLIKNWVIGAVFSAKKPRYSSPQPPLPAPLGRFGAIPRPAEKYVLPSESVCPKVSSQIDMPTYPGMCPGDITSSYSSQCRRAVAPLMSHYRLLPMSELLSLPLRQPSHPAEKGHLCYLY